MLFLLTTMGRRIVIALDDSSVSRETVDWAKTKLVQPDDELQLVSVLEPVLRPDFATTIEGAYPLGEPQECKPHPLQLERVCTFLKSCREDLRAAGVENVKLTTLVSCIGGSTDAGRHICDFAAQNKADMVVLGSRGHSLQRSMLRLMSLGSVSEFVMRHASVPGVLVHKPSLTSPPQQQEQ